MAQFLRPTGDQATGSWSSTPLWSKVDEGVASEDNVTIASDDNTSPDDADFSCNSLSDPNVGTGHILRARWNKSAAGGHSVTAVLELWEGVPGTGNLRATLSVTDISETEATDSYTLSGAEADSISDYTNLYLRVSRQGDTGGNPATRRALVVEAVELEVPDAGAAPTRGQISWAEAEAPFAATAGQISWGELEAPYQATAGRITWAELESPFKATRGLASWAELQAPIASTRGLITWAEAEAPNVGAQNTAGLISWAELQTPLVGTAGRLSHTELESPLAGTRGRLSWSELQTPSLSPTRGQISVAELEAISAATRGRIAWGEFRVDENAVAYRPDLIVAGAIGSVFQSIRREVNHMSLKTITLLDDADVNAETKIPFALDGSQVPATISCEGVAATAEDIEVQKLITGDAIINLSDAADGDFVTIKEGGTAKVLNADNNTLAIYGPGIYRIKTADVAYASDKVTVIVDT